MTDPLEQLRHHYEIARADFDQAAAKHQEAGVEREYQRLAIEHAANAQRETAIFQRRQTLSIAASISALLLVNRIRPEEELRYDEPIFEQRGLFRKRPVQTGVRQQIALEGWPLDLGEYQFRDRFPLTLTVHNNVNSQAPLVWRSLDEAVAKDRIYALDSIPLSAADRKWHSPPFESQEYVPSVFDPKEYDTYEAFSRIESMRRQLHPEVMRWAEQDHPFYIPAETLPEQLQDKEKTPDYEMYLKAAVEEKIRKALAEVAAKYHLLDSYLSSEDELPDKRDV